MKAWKKALAMVLALVMVIPGVYLGKPGSKKVQATDSASGNSYIAKSVEEVERDGKGIPILDGYLFAGWFNEENCTLETAITSGEGSWAKFVPADVLSVKAQSTESVVTEGNNEYLKDNYALRFISSVDSLDYSAVGFEVVYKKGNETKKLTNTTSTVYERIASTTGGVEYKNSPKIFDTKSEYFITAKLGVPSQSQEVNYTVRAFWKTLDGTIVYGAARCVSVKDGWNTTNTINMSFAAANKDSIDEIAAKMETKEPLSVTYGDSNSVKTGSAEIIAVDKETGMVHVRVTLKNNESKASLKSVTEFTFEGGEKVIYRNLYTKYTGTAETSDISWYNVYGENEKEYVIATSADLYGFATLASSMKSGQTIYMVADIEINKEVNAEKPITWTSISSFAGTLDGQGHIISGVKLNPGRGMFTAVSGTLQNFTLSNSIIALNGHNSGAIAGDLSGTLHGICADETVMVEYSPMQHIGGLVGTIVAGKTGQIINCSFAGTMTWAAENNLPSAGGHGGIVGTVRGDCKIINCAMSGEVKGFVTGGLIGFMDQATSKATLRNCLVTGTVSGCSENVGTIVGRIGNANAELHVEDVYTAGVNNGNIKGSVSKNAYIDGVAVNVGVIYGLTEKVEPTAISGSDAWSKLNLDFYSEHNKDGVWVAIDGGLPKLKVAVTPEDIVLEEDHTGNIARLGWYDLHAKKTTGSSATADVVPAEGTEFLIETVGDMYGLRSLVNNGIGFAGHTVELCDDLVFNPNWDGTSEENVNNWDGLSSNVFAGTFDGKNHTISKIYQNRNSYSNGGFIRQVSGTLKNLIISDSLFKSNSNCIAGVVGVLSGTLENVYLNQSVTVSASDASDHVGGLVGAIDTGASIINCGFAGMVSGGNVISSGTGGLVGTVRANKGKAETVTISGCAFTGAVSGTNPVGGIVGMMAGTSYQLEVFVTDCVVSGTVELTTDSSQCGSVVGRVGAKTKLTLENVDTSACNQKTRFASVQGEVIDKDNE